MTDLLGLTWDHPRAYEPLEACTDRWRRAHPQCRVRWERRSLKSFGDDPLGGLALKYDLVVLDHPFVGTVADEGCFIPLDSFIEPAQLGSIADSVGSSYDSYRFGGHQWALPIDAAAHVSVSRSDVLDEQTTPGTWDEVLNFARDVGPERFVLALAPVDCLMLLFTISASRGTPVFQEDGLWSSDENCAEALNVIASLTEFAHPMSLGSNPVAVLDAMAAPSGPAYSPALFGYSNYARQGGLRRLRFGPVPEGDGGSRGVLGGAGIAVSAVSSAIEHAVSLAVFLASPEVQSTTYLTMGGQPAHRVAWTAPAAELAAPGYFTGTRPALESSWLRPRWLGYPSVQEVAGDAIHAHLLAGHPRDIPHLSRTLRRIFDGPEPGARCHTGARAERNDIRGA